MRRISFISNIICVMLIAVMVILLVLRWDSLPNEVPVHFTFDGTPDGFGDRSALIIEPIVALLLFGLIAVLERFPKLWSLPVKITEENMKRLYLITGAMLAVVKVIVTALFLVSVLTAIVEGFPAWTMMVMVNAVLIVAAGGIILLIKNR